MPGHHAGGVAEPLPPQATDPVSGDRNVSQNLSSAIRSCRPHNSTSVYSPPSTTAVEAAAASSYCDATPAQDVVEAGTAVHGIRLFLARSLARGDPARAMDIMRAQDAGVNAFARLLKHLADVFGMDAAKVVHIFIDHEGSSIAFNASGALFFNYHYFQALHLPRLVAAGSDVNKQRAAHMDVVAYWWITLSHELAHNLVHEHSAAHSFYTESFASQFFAGAMKVVMEYRAGDLGKSRAGSVETGVE
jgi:hypothetical protein